MPRSDVVKQYALRAADGVCQGCGDDAPSKTESGDDYLEVHHITRRSDGGADVPENVIAICPNCHRRAHHGRDKQAFNKELKAQAQQRERSVE
ncbi:HNH endonuclease [Halobacterium salinarum]|uniref:HNH endonuclease n=1 Tax=Halobacterium salinarum TaxID=2242 RepID=UPI002556DDB3|nr:HNH endonuclease signature motif containing protein [Halobacterium salinarum]MDL0122394.1 HNH endonuclease signature motif containing protein [Halobacterium salinarum]